MADRPSILPEKGQRTLTAGATGSGKTYFNVWAMLHEPHAPMLIFDTKDEEKFPTLPKARVVTTWDGPEGVIETTDDETVDYIVFRPAVAELAEPDKLDAYLHRAYELAGSGGPLAGVPIYIDEIYSFHKNGRAGPGLVALLTRGRSRGLTTLMSTQRPSFLSRFAITESQRFYIFRLVDRRDRQILGNVIPNFDDDYQAADESGALKDNMFFYYKIGDRKAQLMKPVVLDKKFSTGYTGGAEIKGSDGRLPWIR